jgi:hypothetical protein
MNLLILFVVSAVALTRQEVMQEIKVDDGVYDLTQATFDSMINWNDMVLVCFYQGSQGNYRLMHAYVRGVQGKVKDAKRLFKTAMIDIERAPMIDARYMPINAPEVRFF